MAQLNHQRGLAGHGNVPVYNQQYPQMPPQHQQPSSRFNMMNNQAYNQNQMIFQPGYNQQMQGQYVGNGYSHGNPNQMMGNVGSRANTGNPSLITHHNLSPNYQGNNLQQNNLFPGQKIQSFRSTEMSPNDVYNQNNNLGSTIRNPRMPSYGYQNINNGSSQITQNQMLNPNQQHLQNQMYQMPSQRRSSRYQGRSPSPHHVRDKSPYQGRDTSPYQGRNLSPHHVREKSPYQEINRSPRRFEDSNNNYNLDQNKFEKRDQRSGRNYSRTPDKNPKGLLSGILERSRKLNKNIERAREQQIERSNDRSYRRNRRF